MDELFEDNIKINKEEWINSPYYPILLDLLQRIVCMNIWNLTEITDDFSEKEYRNYIKKYCFEIFSEIDCEEPLDKLNFVHCLKDHIENL